MRPEEHVPGRDTGRKVSPMIGAVISDSTKYSVGEPVGSLDGVPLRRYMESKSIGRRGSR